MPEALPQGMPGATERTAPASGSTCHSVSALLLSESRLLGWAGGSLEEMKLEKQSLLPHSCRGRHLFMHSFAHLLDEFTEQLLIARHCAVC